MKPTIPTTIAPVTPVDRTLTIKLDTLATFGSTSATRREPSPAYLVIEAGPSKWSPDAMPTGHGAPKLQIGDGRWWSWYLSSLIGLKDGWMHLPGNSLVLDINTGMSCVNIGALVEECMKRLMGVIK